MIYNYDILFKYIVIGDSCKSWITQQQAKAR